MNRLVLDLEVDEGLGGAVDPAFLDRVLGEAFAGRLPGDGVQVGLTITTDEGIRELNGRYRGIDSATDVLSFPLLDYQAPERPKSLFPMPPGEPLSVGDIVLSYPRAVEQAKEYGHSLEREMAFLLVHGAMHLLGYDHEDHEDQASMRREEEAVLESLGLGR